MNWCLVSLILTGNNLTLEQSHWNNITGTISLEQSHWNNLALGMFSILILDSIQELYALDVEFLEDKALSGLDLNATRQCSQPTLDL